MIILCGGLGKRLREVVCGIPKPMAVVNNKPFLHYLIKFWINKGMKSFILSVGYLSDSIKEYFGEEFEGASIKYVEEAIALGTGGAIKRSLDAVTYDLNNIVVLNGDTWNNIDIKSFYYDFHNSTQSITMSIKRINQNDRYGSLLIDELNRVTSFSEKEGGNLINTGCYLLSKSFITEELRSFPEKFSFERDFLPTLVEKRMLNISWQESDFIDIGIPSDYYRFIKESSEFI